MSQTSFGLDSDVALPGQLADSGEVETVSYVANEDIYPGRLVTVRTDGKIEHPQGTSLDLLKVVGIAKLNDTHPQDSSGVVKYVAGQVVPVVRKARIYAVLSGGTDTAYTRANVKHSSTTATDRGKLSASATSATSGSEISATNMLFFKNMSDSGLCCVELGAAMGLTGAAG